jgi:DNA-binding MarR family transcriptional regulator
MTEVTNLKLPIGYWLKQADKVLTEQINQAQAVHGVSRTEWQILNLLKENGRATKESIFEILRTFVDASEFQEIINRLIERGWIDAEVGCGDYQLTDIGEAQHERIFTTQKEVRQRAMQGISQDEYATVIRVLQQMVENLNESASHQRKKSAQSA